MNQLVINTRESEKRLAVIKDQHVIDYHIEQPNSASLVGNIYVGIVEKVIPALNAAFVFIGKERKGYLHLSQVPSYFLSKDENKDKKPIGHYLHHGEKILVQVIKDEIDSKDCRLSGNIEFPGKQIVYMPYGDYIAISKKLPAPSREKWRKWGEEIKNEDEGFVVRTSVESVQEEVVYKELTELRSQFIEVKRKADHGKAPSLVFQNDGFVHTVERIVEKFPLNEIYCDEYNVYEKVKDLPLKDNIAVHFYKGSENIFSAFKIDQEPEKLHKKIVWLRNGANIVIEEAEACTIIDVNSGKSTGKQQKEAAVMETNLYAAKEIARQVQLRNISGIILVDFINIKQQQNRNKLLHALKQAFANDPNRTTIYGFTSLGMVEMARKRTTPSLKELTRETCPVCHGLGSVLSPATVAFKLERELWEYKNTDVTEIIVEATVDVIQFFEEPPQRHVENLEAALRFNITFEQLEMVKAHYHIKRIRRD